MNFFEDLEIILQDYWEAHYKNPKYILLGEKAYQHLLDSIEHCLPEYYTISKTALVDSYKGIQILKVNREVFYELVS